MVLARIACPNSVRISLTLSAVGAVHDISKPPYNGPDCPHDGGCIYKPYSLNKGYCGGLDDCKEKGARKTDCEMAFRNYFCFLNFPRCDDENKTLPMCRSACINLMKACKYSTDFWRCGPSKYFNVSVPVREPRPFPLVPFFDRGTHATRDTGLLRRS